MQIKKDERNEIKSNHIQDIAASITSYSHRSMHTAVASGSRCGAERQRYHSLGVC